MPEGVRILALTTTPRSAPIVAGLHIRTVDPTDRTRLATLYLHSYPPEIGAGDLDEALAEIDQTFAGDFGELRPDASLIALFEGHPAGAILVTARSIWDADLPGPFVIDLFVTPRHRGLGIGRALLVGAAGACVTGSDATLSLRVGAGTSPAAHALYTRLEFSEPS